MSEQQADASGMDFDQVREFVAASAKAKELDAELKLAKADLERMKVGILERFEEAGVGSIRIDGKTVYTHRQLWAGKADYLDPSGATVIEKGKPIKVDHNEFIDHIKEAGLNDMVKETVAASTLSAWARELSSGADGMPALPPELVGFVKVTEKFDVRVRNK